MEEMRNEAETTSMVSMPLYAVMYPVFNEVIGSILFSLHYSTWETKFYLTRLLSCLYQYSFSPYEFCFLSVHISWFHNRLLGLLAFNSLILNIIFYIYKFPRCIPALYKRLECRFHCLINISDQADIFYKVERFMLFAATWFYRNVFY